MGEIHRVLLIKVKKGLSQKGILKYTESLLFLTYLKRENPEENLDLFKQLFLIEPIKVVKYGQKLIFSLK